MLIIFPDILGIPSAGLTIYSKDLISFMVLELETWIDIRYHKFISHFIQLRKKSCSADTVEIISGKSTLLTMKNLFSPLYHVREMFSNLFICLLLHS
jgi:hypothetical protein